MGLFLKIHEKILNGVLCTLGDGYPEIASRDKRKECPGNVNGMVSGFIHVDITLPGRTLLTVTQNLEPE